MAEQSHLEAMREAIKGDLERARSRNPSIFERPAAPPVVELREEPAPEPPVVEPDPVAATAAPDPAAATAAPDPVSAEPEPEPETAHEPAPEASPVGAEPKRGFLSRLAFWR